LADAGLSMRTPLGWSPSTQAEGLPPVDLKVDI
jgi:hypothetical protein